VFSSSYVTHLAAYIVVSPLSFAFCYLSNDEKKNESFIHFFCCCLAHHNSVRVFQPVWPRFVRLHLFLISAKKVEKCFGILQATPPFSFLTRKTTKRLLHPSTILCYAPHYDMSLSVSCSKISVHTVNPPPVGSTYVYGGMYVLIFVLLFRYIFQFAQYQHLNCPASYQETKKLAQPLL